jgi:hypothetical protein
MTDLNRLLQLSGIDSEKQRTLKAINEAKRELLAQLDHAAVQTQAGHQLDEGFFDGLRASLGTIMTVTGKAGEKALKAASAMKDSIKAIYDDEKAKVELKNLTKALQGLSVSIENLGKEAPTILKKDADLAELMKVFVDCAKRTALEVAKRAQLEKVEPTMNDKPDLRGGMAPK